jgi:hypothetical protein
MAVCRFRFAALVWRGRRPPERFAEFVAWSHPESAPEQRIEDWQLPQKNHGRVGGGISSV